MKKPITEIEKRVESFKKIESFREKYGYDDYAFSLDYYSDGSIGVFSRIVGSSPIDDNFGDGQLKNRLSATWKDMIHILEINLDRINPKSPWYKPNMEKNDENSE